MIWRTDPYRSSFRLSLSTLAMALGVCAGFVACGSGGSESAGPLGSQQPLPPARLQHAYVASPNPILDQNGDIQNGEVYIYTVNQDGTLTPNGTTAAGKVPEQIAFHPFHQFAYVVNSYSHDVSMYQVNPTTGALSPLEVLGTPLPPLPIFTNPVSITVLSKGLSKGRFAYTANGAGTSVSTLGIDPTTGALSLIETVPVGIPLLSKETFFVAVDSTGQFLYAAVGDPTPPHTGNVIHAFSIDQTTGKLTSVGIISAPPIAVHITIHPTEPFLYVASGIANMVTAYRIEANGALTLENSLNTGGSAPRAVGIERSGKFAYVTNGATNNVSIFSIAPQTGALTLLSVTPQDNDPGVVGRFLAIDSTGHFLYLSSSKSSSVSAFSINSDTGALQPLGKTPPTGTVDSLGITIVDHS